LPIALSPGHHARAFACRRASDFPRGAKAFLDQKLFAAIGQRDLVSVENLIREGASVEARGTNGMTPLMEAAEQGSVPLLSLLLENGAKPNAKDEQGETALSWAARGGWVRAVDLLGGLSDEAAKKHALFEAARGGPVVLDFDPSPPIHPQIEPSEVVQSWTATVESLLAHGAALEAKDEDGSTPLLEAAAYAQTDVFKLLMQKGARLDARDKYGNTALIAAACQCAVATMNSANTIVQIALASGADVNARNCDGETALMMASGMSGDAYVLKLLLDFHADPSLKDHKGRTALAIAISGRRDDKIAVLKRVPTR
jgi:ankyrin repeat protein